MWREIAWFEVRLQRREFLSAFYVAVFFFLTFGYTSSGAIELVSERGVVPKNSPWALAHAMAGVTAFGQVITTMITATAVMRDVATRQQELLFATRLTRRDYLLGRWLGALAVMLVVYAAVPVGLVAGTLMPWVDTTTLLPFSTNAYLRPLALLVLPNLVVVSALFFTAGAMRRSFMTILLLGVGLVALWSTGVAFARDGHVFGVLIDPFGNAALEHATRSWSEGERRTHAIPMGGWLIANRALWLAIGGAALAALARAFRFEVLTVLDRGRRMDHPPRVAAVPSAPPPPSPRAPSTWHSLVTEGRWIFRWTLRERGFVTLMSLGALNALANAWRAGGVDPTAGDVLGAVQDHARLFLILVATIYAGELVWRERDVRVDALSDVVPVGTGTLVAGKLLGLLAAQLALVAPLAVVALAVGVARGAVGLTPVLALRWIGGFVFPFVAQLTLLSLLVHAVVQHKVAGHVLLITGWVAAVAMERSLALPPLLRYANLPHYTWNSTSGFGGAGVALGWFALYWSAVAGACGTLAIAWWVRGVPMGWAHRIRTALRQLQRAPGGFLAAWLTLAALAALRLTAP